MLHDNLAHDIHDRMPIERVNFCPTEAASDFWADRAGGARAAPGVQGGARRRARPTPEFQEGATGK